MAKQSKLVNCLWFSAGCVLHMAWISTLSLLANGLAPHTTFTMLMLAVPLVGGLACFAVGYIGLDEGDQQTRKDGT